MEKSIKGKYPVCPQKSLKHYDGELKVIWLGNRKWRAKEMIETGDNVCDRSVRNWLDEIGFILKRAKWKPALTPKQKKTRLQWARKVQSLNVDESDSGSSPISIDQGYNAGTFTFSPSNELQGWLPEEDKQIHSLISDMELHVK